MKYVNDLRSKIVLGLTMATTTLATNLHTYYYMNHTDEINAEETNMDSVEIIELAVIGITLVTIGLLFTDTCTCLMSRLQERIEGMQIEQEETNERREIVDTRDITEMVAYENGFDSDATIFMLAKDIPGETTSRLSDITVLR